MREKQTVYDWVFCGQWIVSCAIGTAIMGMAAYTLRFLLAEAAAVAGNELLGFLVGGILFGAFFALGGTLGPGLLLQNKGVPAGKWIGYSVAWSAIAMSGGTFLMSKVLDFIPAAVSALFLGLTFGLPMGFVQWRLLTRQGISATVWPLIITASYLLGFGFMVYFGVEGREGDVGVMGLLVGTLSGLGMTWLLDQEPELAI